MPLNFFNGYSNTVFVAMVYFDSSCGPADQFRKEGWWAVSSGQAVTIILDDLSTINRYAAWYAEEYSESGGATWSGTGNNYYQISGGPAFNQCYDDNTNCDEAPDFNPIDFAGNYGMTVNLGAGSSQFTISTFGKPVPPHHDVPHNDHSDSWAGGHTDGFGDVVVHGDGDFDDSGFGDG